MVWGVSQTAPWAMLVEPSTKDVKMNRLIDVSVLILT